MSSRFSPVLILVLSFLLVYPSMSSAQDKDAQLRKMIGASETASLRVSLKPALPTTNPLRVALAFGLDVSVTKNFIRWVQDDWNSRGDAKKYGAIELVDDVATADVVLTRFVDRQTYAGSNTSGAIRDYGLVAKGRSESQTLMPVYAYILNKVESGYEIVGGYEDVVPASLSTGEQLWLEFKKLMKDRPKLR